MAQDRENDAGGILFTDFDRIAPETEESSQSPSPQPPSPQQPELPELASLEALASALDIDFEDDEGWAASATASAAAPVPPPAQPQPAPAAQITAASSSPAAAAAAADPHPDDELLSLPEAPAALAPASSPAAVPSWADFTRAFQTGSAANTPASPPATSPAGLPASAADIFFRAVSAPSATAPSTAAARGPGADGMQVAFVDYRPLPGEAGFSFGAATGAAGTGLAAFAPDDGEMDILSLLPPMEEGADEADFEANFGGDFETGLEAGPEAEADSSGPAGTASAAGRRRPAAPTGPWRGGRLGVAPARETPYGGLERLDEWFRPPPVTDSGPAATARRDWFVPPDAPAGGQTARSAPAPASQAAAGSGGTSAARVSASAKTDVFSPVPAADEEAAAFAPDAAPAAVSGSAGTGPGAQAAPLDAVASLDSADSAAAAGDAATDDADDIFSDFDLESTWTQKAAARAARPGTAVYDAPASADAPDAPAGSAAGRPPTRYADMFSGIDLEEAWREKQRRRKDTAVRQKEDAYRAAAASGADTLVIPASAFDSHDTIIMPAGGFDLPDLPPAPEVAAARSTVTKKKKKKAPPLAPGLSGGDDAMGFLDDLDSFLDDGAPDDAPVDADAEKKPRASGLPRSLEELEIGDLISPEEEEAVAAAARVGGTSSGEADYFPAGRVIGGDSPTGEVIAGDIPAGATIDDIIGQVKFAAAPVVNDSVSPPEVGDNLIDTEAPPGTMDAIEAELEAEAAAGNAEDESGEAVDGQTGDAGDDNVAASVPVDPAAALSAFDDMDFSGLDDLLDDETKAMLEEDAAEDAGMAEDGGAEDGTEEDAADAGPTGFAGLRQRAVKLAMRALPISWFNKVKRMIAWRENWWFYCDLFAAVVASASLAVIFSYYMWYRE